ncbi:XrtA-associated tyrosine autokinase [Zooshikella ganghwensis]|uniref:non-specific protein-tyrosine kinase n=1 Tax=Zooshikella ganghwensis TaxID=202772 RepID=A0A4P9VSC9_9GAMM|nr:XrtA-associated tyrosine autokinase [Zooshikella ganghwensis]RDH44910.1 exopolysaccharide biosynthesis protein [Zooshikella ganghwensis]
MDTIQKALEKHQQKFQEEYSDTLKQEGDASDQQRDPFDNTTEGDPSIKKTTYKEIEISFDHLALQGYILPNEDRSLIKEQFRQIKRPLLNKAFGREDEQIKNGNLIMVTSSSPAEGKTFNAINLALSIALERDRNVVLVDADVINPSLNQALSVTTDVGLLDYLNNEVNDVADILYKTNIENLNIIPAGTAHHLTNELLASDSMSNLMSEMASRYSDRVIILDAPPLLHTTEAPILATLAGQIVMVVKEGVTKQQTVKDALSLLDPSMNIGLVLNKSRQKQDGNYYGYYGT